MTNYFLAPTPRWQGRDKTGQPAINGYVYTWENLTRIPKATASDATGINLNSNPVSLDGKGEANIYWNDDNLYSIALYSADGQLIETQDNYPISEGNGGGSVTVTTLEDNFVRNPQFYWWFNTTNFENYSMSSNPFSDFVAADWIFNRDSISPTVNLSQGVFALGQTEITEGTPTYYFHYECTAVNSSGETFKNLAQSYKSVQTLSNTEVSFAFWARSSLLNSISVSLTQYFGAGGTPSGDVVTPLVASTTLSSAWTYYTGTAVIPSVSGKLLGTDGNDCLFLQINYPLNTVADVDISTVQLQKRSTPSTYPYLTTLEEYFKLIYKFQAIYKTGDVKITMDVNDPSLFPELGWIQLGVNNETIGSPDSGATYPLWITKALFFILWESVSNTYLPIYTSSGVLTTKGSNAEDDWNDNKRISLPTSAGRAIGNVEGISGSPPAGFYDGTATVSLTEDQNGPHDHDYDAWDGGYSGTGRGDGNDTLPNAPNSHTTTQSGTGAPHNNIPPTVYMYFYIKL